MSDEQPQEISSVSTPTLDELLLQLGVLKQSDNTPTYISLLEQILQLLSREDDPSTWAALQFTLGNAQQQNQGGDRKDQLIYAITCYDAALTVYTREHTPANWVATQQYKRSALCDLAELQEGIEHLGTLRAIVSCCDAVLTVCTRDATPTNWAVAFYQKAIALHDIAETMQGDERRKVLQEAIFCYDAALTVYTRENAPIEWAATQNSKGMSLYKLAEPHEGNTWQIDLQEALACYTKALTVWDRERTPAFWAAVQHNKGMVLHDLAEALEGTHKKEALLGALTCYKEALTHYTQERDLFGCARELSNKGNVLFDFSRLVRGAEQLETLYTTLACYDAALTGYTFKATPADWAMVQNNKGNTLLSLAERLRGTKQKETLQQALICCEKALTVYTYDAYPIDWGITLRNRGNILRALSELFRGEERKEIIQKAVACFDRALSEPHDQLGLMNWARTENDKGLALHILSMSLEAEESKQALQSSLACYDAALSVFIREIAPSSWAEIQNNKSVSLSSLAELLTGEERVVTLQTALDCCNCALTAFTTIATPFSWALTQSNKGNVLRSLAETLAGSKRLATLQGAVTCYDHALAIYTREETPLDWARTYNNKGITFRNMMGLLAGSERLQMLRSSIFCFNTALLERKREITPMDWAATQESKGNALHDLAELLSNDEQVKALQAALTCFNAALEERYREVSPFNWARVQSNKGNVLRSLARTHNNTDTRQREVLYEALACYNAALLEYRRNIAPMYWAMTQSNKGVVLNDIARITQERSEQRALLQEALSCFDAALLEYQREMSSANWATVQVSRGSVLCNIAGLQEEATSLASLHEALLCYNAALDVYTREIFPAHHHRIAQSIGMRLFDASLWVQAAHYLSTALDALDDLFTLEVTTHGRQATLVTSTDLTAHLAYALVRGDGLTNNVQAARALERGRARATGEAISRQEAQLAAAERLAPELLERFRETSNRIAVISSKKGSSTTLQGIISTAGDTGETPASPELIALRAMDMQLADYEEARAARAAYDEVVARIRQEMPDFLYPGGVFEVAVKELKADECLTYVATTPAGAVTLLIRSSDAVPSQPVVKGWWDELLTSSQVAQLLVGSSSAGGKLQHGDGGLLAVSSHRRRIRRVLDITMRTIGAPDGVLTALALHCRAVHVRRLVLIPCGLLGLLPLHAAMVPCSSDGTTTEPLIDVVQVCYAPSAHIWAASRRRGGSLHSVQLEALVVGDPQPQSEETPPLPGAKDEAAAISTLISQTVQGRVCTYIGEAATLSNVIDILRGQHSTLTHVHFACHGVAELSKPQTSGVLLAYGTRLAVYDVLDPAIALLEQLRLVVLSACRTALVGTELPDEAVGLPSAWLQVGAKNVLASLWPVSDKITLVFMTKFYELHLLDGLEPTEALWLTQRWLRGLPTWREDFRAMGAKRAAAGAEANEVVGVLASTRGAMTLADDAERAANEKEDESMDWEKLDEESVTWNQDTIKLPGRWTDPYHWAAFAIYGA